MLPKLLTEFIAVNDVSISDVKDLDDVRVAVSCKRSELVQRIDNLVDSVRLRTHVLLLLEALRETEVGFTWLDADTLEILVGSRDVETIRMRSVPYQQNRALRNVEIHSTTLQNFNASLQASKRSMSHHFFLTATL